MNYMESAHFDKGIFVMSLDTELAWGMLDSPISLIDNKDYFHETRKAVDGIIRLLEKYKISATWVIVGSLLLDNPNFDKDLIGNIIKDLDEGTRKQYVNMLKDKWIWCGRDIFEKIKQCSVPQEIGSHSFSHPIFTDKRTTKNKAIKEFKKSMEILQQRGIKPLSFFFPRNQVHYLEELKNEGFCVYRDVEPSWYSNKSRTMKKICHMIDQALAITPPVVIPSYSDGLIKIPASMMYLSMHGFRKYIPLVSRIIKAHKGIQKAIDDRKIFHLWFHPFNIATDQVRMLKGLEEILREVDIKRYEGKLEVMTMGEIAALVTGSGCDSK